MRRLALSLLLGWGAWVSATLLLAGHGVVASIGAGLLVGAQAASGALIWNRISVSSTSLPTVSIGSLIGFIAAALGGVVTLGTPLASWGWALPIGIGVVLLSQAESGTSNVSGLTRVAILALALGVLGLSTEWTWLAPSAMALMLVLFAWRGSLLGEPFGDSPRSTRKLVAALVALPVAVQLMMLFLRGRNWPQFRQARFDIPDHLFFDAVGRAAARFGGSDNALVAGVQAPYHWLPYAWAGRITLLVDGYSPALISHLIQAAFIPLVGLLTSVLAERLGARTGLAAIVGLIVVTAVGVPITLVQVLAAYSPSQLAATALLLTIATLIVGPSLVRLRWSGAVMVGLLTFSAVGSKVFVFVPIMGVVVGCIFGPHRRVNRDKVWLSLATVLGGLAGVLYFFAGGMTEERATFFDVSLAGIAVSDGPIGMEVDAPFLRILGSISLAMLILAFAPGVALRMRPSYGERALLLGGSVSILAGFLYRGQGYGVEYLFNFGLALLVVASAVRLDRRVRIAAPAVGQLCLAAFMGVVVAAAWSNAYMILPSSTTMSSVGRSFILFAPVGVSLMVAQMMTRGIGRSVVAIVGMMAVTFGSYVSWVPRYALIHVRNAETVIQSNSLVGRPEYLEALRWLRRNSPDTDVVATNRHCSDALSTYPDCDSTWSLVAAMSGRRVYAECGSFSRRWYDGIDGRISLSIGFASSPSAVSASQLIEDGVRWMFIDRAIDGDVDYGSLATVRFENDHARVLELSGVGP